MSVIQPVLLSLDTAKPVRAEQALGLLDFCSSKVGKHGIPFVSLDTSRAESTASRNIVGYYYSWNYSSRPFEPRS
jgi:hypothetical protein